MENSELNKIYSLLERIDTSFDGNGDSNSITKTDIEREKEYTINGEIPVFVPNKKDSDEDKQQERKTKSKELFDGLSTNIPLIGAIMYNRQNVLGQSTGTEEFMNYNIGLVKKMCSNIIDKTFTVYDSQLLDYELMREQMGDLPFDSHRMWYGLYNSKKNNTNGRFGFVFEMLMGNVPTNDYSADLKNAETPEESVEAKSKTSKTHGIVISKTKLESIARQLIGVSKELHDECQSAVDNVASLINEIIAKDVAKYKGYNIEYAKQNTKSKIVTVSIDERGALLRKLFKITIVLSKGLFRDEALKHTKDYSVSYNLYCSGAMNNKTGELDLKFNVVKNGTEISNGTELSVKLPLDVIIFKIMQKCPNMVIAFGYDYDSPDMENKDESNTSYVFGGFKFYSKNPNMSENEQRRKLVNLILKNVFKIKLEVNGNAHAGDQSYRVRPKTPQHSLSMSIIPEFNEQAFITHMSNGDSIYVEV